ncbi:MAG: hypothetical protein ABEI57_01930 [Halapricum sp.]
MASESRDTTDVTVSVPADLESWLDQRASDLGVDRETVLGQLLASYRAADELDGEVAISDPDALDAAVESAVGDRLPEVADAVEQRIQVPYVDALDERVDALEDSLEELQADYQSKLDDVRERVIQVKREVDAKADSDHTHDALEDRLDSHESSLSRLDERGDGRIDELATELDGVESQIADLRGRLDERDDGRVADVEDRLDDVQEKLQTVAWVVRDLRDAQSPTGGATVEAIKRSAAEHDVTRARCENCGDGVEIGLLTEPSCPHCDAALDGLEPSGRLFGLGSPKLTVAAQIEAGADEDGDELDEIETRGDRR